jgi:hypothetical protein
MGVPAVWEFEKVKVEPINLDPPELEEIMKAVGDAAWSGR